MRTVAGIGVLWAGYALMFYGYCLVKGYNVSLLQVINPQNIQKYGPTPLGSGGNPLIINVWPPPVATDTVVIPNGSSADIGNGGLG